MLCAVVKMMGLYSSGALGGVEVLDGGLVGGELTAHVLSAQAAAHAAATAAAAAHQQHQQQQIAVQQISEYCIVYPSKCPPDPLKDVLKPLKRPSSSPPIKTIDFLLTLHQKKLLFYYKKRDALKSSIFFL